MKLVADIFNAHSAGTEIIVASRYKETDLFHIEQTRRSISKNINKATQVQLSLF
jgi:hypothetical protein